MQIETFEELDRFYQIMRRKLVRDCRDKGMTQAQTARKLGISRWTLNKIIRQHDIDWRVFHYPTGPAAIKRRRSIFAD